MDIKGDLRKKNAKKWKKTVNLIQEKKLQKYIDEKSQTYNHLIISNNSTQKPAMTTKKKKKKQRSAKPQQANLIQRK